MIELYQKWAPVQSTGRRRLAIETKQRLSTCLFLLGSWTFQHRSQWRWSFRAGLRVEWVWVLAVCPQLAPWQKLRESARRPTGDYFVSQIRASGLLWEVMKYVEQISKGEKRNPVNLKVHLKKTPVKLLTCLTHLEKVRESTQPFVPWETLHPGPN